jgi:hypothetical protein
VLNLKILTVRTKSCLGIGDTELCFLLRLFSLTGHQECLKKLDFRILPLTFNTSGEVCIIFSLKVRIYDGMTRHVLDHYRFLAPGSW